MAGSLSPEELDAALGLDLTPEETKKYTKQEERLMGGFEEIIRFHQENSDVTKNSLKDFFAELYAIRLEKLRKLVSQDARISEILRPLDTLGLLNVKPEISEEIPAEDLQGGALLDALGIEETENPLEKLQFVRSFKEKQMDENETSARRKPCIDFENFKEKFIKIQQDLENGIRRAVAFRDEGNIEVGQFFILKGQICYVAEKEKMEGFDSKGNPKARLRVIFDNQTETPLQQASLWRRLFEPESKGRRILFANQGGQAVAEIPDLKTGSIYVVRSLSRSPEIQKYGACLLKIGMTTDSEKKRLADAKNHATYLYAPVEIVQTYEIGGKWTPEAIEKILHKVFAHVRAKIEIPDGFGNLHRPQEWFILPKIVIDEFMKALAEGNALGLRYDAEKMSLERQ